MKAETTTVTLPVKHFNRDTEKEITAEFQLPEYSPDISRLIRIRAKPQFEKCDTFSEGVNVSGKVVFSMLYESDYKRKIANVQHTVDFSQKINIHNFSGNADFDVRLFCRNINCRLLNQRKSILRCLLSIELITHEKRPFQLLSVDSGNLNTFFKESDLLVKSQVSNYSEPFSFNEKCECDRVIADVIQKDINVRCDEIIRDENSVRINATADIKALCEAETDGAVYFNVEKSIPLTMEMFCEDPDMASVKLNIIDFNVAVNPNEYGENKQLQVILAIDANVAVSGENVIRYAEDAFCQSYVNHIKKSQLQYDEMAFSEDMKLSLEKAVEFDVGAANEILDAACDVHIVSTSGDEQGITVRGTADYSVLVSTNDGIVGMQASESFEKLVSARNTENLTLDTVVINVRPSAAVINDNTIGIKTNIDLVGNAYTKSAVNAAVDLTFEEKAANEFEEDCVVFYYPNKNEQLWDIAKQYYVNPAKIREDNAAMFDAQGNFTERFLQIKK